MGWTATMKTYLKGFGILKMATASWKSICSGRLACTVLWRSQAHSVSTIHISFHILDIQDLIMHLAILSQKSQEKNNYRRFRQQSPWASVTRIRTLTVAWLLAGCFRKPQLLRTAQLLWAKLSARCCWTSLLSTSFPNDYQIKRSAFRNGSSLIQLYSDNSAGQEGGRKTSESREHPLLAAAYIYLGLKWN